MTYFYGFECRKWTIIVMCLFLIVARIFAIISLIEGTATTDDEDIKEHDKNSKEFNFKWLIIQLIKCAIILVGLYGAIKEHLWFSLTFCVLFLYAAVNDIIEHAKSLYLLSAILTFLLLIDISFVIDLFRHYYSSSSSTKISIRTTISGKDSVKNSKFSKKTSTKNSKDIYSGASTSSCSAPV
ncbi:hypothetical protein DERP_009511 [Dermatophagoides pteronyssinus]|uniref:Uncharacterized protein n=1 Tax=Dermatophagoides pteronyssinus TaxID=6956 RepID=A0ABQ8IUI8_DERPT|nr:hypothetical protein DERP_009511 [Dermatophagoides pteronyssinus]